MQISEEEKKAIDRINHVKKELEKDKQEMIDFGTYELYEIFSNDLDMVLNLIKKQNKEIKLSKIKSIGEQGCLKCKTVENVVNLRRDNIILNRKIKKLNKESGKKEVLYQKALTDLVIAKKMIDEIKLELREHLSFENRLKRDNTIPDEFNQGRFYVSHKIKDIIDREKVENE